MRWVYSIDWDFGDGYTENMYDAKDYLQIYTTPQIAKTTSRAITSSVNGMVDIIVESCSIELSGSKEWFCEVTSSTASADSISLFRYIRRRSLS